ncbi:MAG: hypothetical protein HY735_22460 [Verrucomicrobia bacterium]|nr:hypothetical protein [Verrucomicrobiota bacterium]
MPSPSLNIVLANAQPKSTSQELDELVRHIRHVLPDQKLLTHVHHNQEARLVEFTWHSRHFVVRPTLEVFELKGKTLMITGASQLMQAALRTKDRNIKVVGMLVATLQDAEDNMRVHPEKAFNLLKQVKETLHRMAGKSAAARKV